jgi:hypothetical protein
LNLQYRLVDKEKCVLVCRVTNLLYISCFVLNFMLIGGQDMNRKEKLSLEKCYLSSLICVEFVFEYY